MLLLILMMMLIVCYFDAVDCSVFIVVYPLTHSLTPSLIDTTERLAGGAYLVYDETNRMSVFGRSKINTELTPNNCCWPQSVVAIDLFWASSAERALPMLCMYGIIKKD